MDISYLEILNDFRWYWLVAVAIFFLGFWSLLRKRNKERQGSDGEEFALNELGNEYEVFRDIVIPSQGGMSHIDFVVASPYGIFVIDVREEEGIISGDLNSREWKVGKKGTIYNPVWRNQRHMNGLEKLIGRLKMESLVAFAKAKLKGNFGANVVNLRKMTAVIKSRNMVRVYPEQLEFANKMLGSFCGGKIN